MKMIVPYQFLDHKSERALILFWKILLNLSMHHDFFSPFLKDTFAKWKKKMTPQKKSCPSA